MRRCALSPFVKTPGALLAASPMREAMTFPVMFEPAHVFETDITGKDIPPLYDLILLRSEIAI